MPRFYITFVDIDDQNREHITRRGLAEDDFQYMLLGLLTATRNKAGRTADYVARAKALDGTEWIICFNYQHGEARPITAFPA
ncbi:hypothetical protein ACWFQT_08060 [Cellulosimicrobium cellulans]